MKKFFIISLAALLITGNCYSQGIEGYEYISPVPNSMLVSKNTNLIIRYGGKIDRQSIALPNRINVVGEESGFHSYNLLLSDDNATLVLNLDVPFLPDEQVNVVFDTDIKTISGQTLPAINYSFKISPMIAPVTRAIIKDDGEVTLNSESSPLRKTASIASDSIPSDFPKIKVSNSVNPTDGYTFMTTDDIIPGLGYYLMIIKNDGTPLWYKKFANHYPTDFRMQPNGMLSYADIKEDYFFAGGGESVYKVMDSTYTVVDSFKTGNGYVTDSHDFQLLPNGHALLLSYDLQMVDMSKIVPNGKPGAYVAGSIIQELDADKNVVFQWRTWDYIQIDESYFDLTLAAMDPMHANAVDVDIDGNLLVSFRNISQIIKINRQTGEIMWRLGGKKNQFTFINEHAENAPLYFSRPHDIRSLSNGHITFFDNGLDHKPAYSRAVEYEIDTLNKTATLVWEFKHPNKVYGATQGDVQRLPNGNTMIGWGSASKTNINWPAATEVTPSGEIVFELMFENKGMLSYRALKYPWKMNANTSQVTVYELWKGNDYTFNNESDTTYASLRLDNFSGSPYNYVTLTSTQLAPVNPQFTGQAPIVFKKRIYVASDLVDISGSLSFRADKIAGQYDPNEIVVYHRNTEGHGLFEPLGTTYNPVTKTITASISAFGEFIFGIPQGNSIAKIPKQLTPADSSSVNQILPVKFSWTPNGYVNSYRLQIADNPQFANSIIDIDSVKTSVFVMNSVNPKSTYYWHVQSINNSGASGWSPTFSFHTTAPFIKVISPNGGEKIQRGLPFYIKWEGNIDDSVTVELYKAGQFFQTLDTTVSSGVYSWMPSVKLQTGTDYAIEIKSLKEKTLFDLSDSDFEIIDTTTTSVANQFNSLPLKYNLEQNYPNPFNPTTQIRYSIANAGIVALTIFDVLGRQVEKLFEGYRAAGVYTVNFDASRFSSGIYFYRIECNSFSKVRKMQLIK